MKGTFGRGTGKDGAAGIALFRLIIPALLITLLLLSAGCLQTPHQPLSSSPTGSGPRGESSGFYLYQNVVNTSAGSLADIKNPATSPDDKKASAIAEAMDSQNPVTRDFAVSLIPQRHGGSFNLAQICDLWDAVNSRWTYVEDPRGNDFFSPASRTIALGLKGDCDDFAIVVAAMMRSVGGDTRIICAWDGTDGHAYPEVYIGTTQGEFDAAAAYIRQRYRITDVGCHITNGTAGPRYWLNLDWWSGHPGGRFFADDGTKAAYYPDGSWERVELQAAAGKSLQGDKPPL